ncbi:WxL domain-containing protein [Lactobacillus sp. CBA3606]|uniref:WxL domain-containing protein n=1 Tax=Lactobacillus sp. CBA3606 TaxID=2099789 RepID=UPI000CFC829E|nr:WxL domain-containing protein [Lactobacillus sp. CBA3606]AVK64087.1 WxL domain-containing protein [Lactobacillus sp. CBA3606]
MKKIIGSLLLSGALLVSVALPTVANAAENRDGSTNVTATFTAGNTDVTPVDPTDPDTPSTGGDGNNGSNTGNEGGSGLSLIYVTNKLDFGSHAIDVLNSNTYAANYTNADDTKTNADTSALWGNKAVIEVSDTRGTNNGWSLQVSGSALKSTSGDTIEGGTLALPTGDVTNSGTATNDAKSVAVTNALGTATNVLTAAKDGGAGVTVDQLDPTNIKLTVPANTAKAEAYSTTVNWSLTDTPAS